jgi:DNA-binding transcriptional ArsR family regulator
MLAPMKADDVDATFFALASDLRRRMLDLLKREGGCNVNRVCEFFAVELGRHAVMKHLATLERGGLLVTAKDGRDKRLWFDRTPLPLIHERWTTELSAYGAARLTQLNDRAEGAELHTLQQRSPSPGRKVGKHG